MKHLTTKNTEGTEAVIRELMLAVEFLRSACELSQGKTKADSQRLTCAMRVGIRVNSRHYARLYDYQKDSFWADVRALPESFGLAIQEVVK